MENTTIYSIGHGVKKIEKFISELVAYDINYLLDIRSKPFSRWNPQFNQKALELSLSESKIKYIFMGKELGGLPDDRSCYDEEGKVVYNIIKEKDFFLQGLERLKTANFKRLNVVIMCSESKPEECHRSKLIGVELSKLNIELKHIINHELFLSQSEVLSKISKGKGTINLFEDNDEFKSRKSY